MAEVNPRAFVLLVLILFWFTNNPEPPQSNPYTQIHNEEIIENEWAALKVLNSTHHGDFDPSQSKWLNISGFRGDEGYNWEIYKDIRKRAYAQATYALGDQVGAALGDELSWEQRPAVYKNVTGIVYGDWKLSDIGRDVDRKSLNVSATYPEGTYGSKGFDRNITTQAGSVHFELNELESGMAANNNSIRVIRAAVSMEDDAAFSSSWQMILHGVHFVNSGHILLTTTSEKFAGIFGLPQMALTNHMFSLSHELLGRSILKTIEGQSTAFDFRSNPWTSLFDGGSDSAYSAPHCEYVMYLQQHSVNGEGTVADSIDFIETELRYPTGAPSRPVPEMVFSMVAFSPDCGFAIESNGPRNGAHLQALKKELLEGAFRHTVEVLALIFVAQIFFLMRQMKETSTPSTRHRISYYTISILALGDGFISMTLLILGLKFLPIFYTTFATFFLGFASVLYLGVRYVLDIWVVQFTERQRQQRQTRNSTPPSAQESGHRGEEALLPAPVTANRGDTGATPIVLPSDQDFDGANGTQTNGAVEDETEAHRRAVYMQFCFMMFVIFVLAAVALQLPAIIRHTFMKTLVFVYLSFWCPQIYRNLLRNCRKALRWDFILGQSILRLIPIVYLFAVEDNILVSKTDMNVLYVYLGWVWMQIFSLWTQEHLGPRFFVPTGWVPPAYDYHPILREDEEDMNLPIETTDSVDTGDPSTAMKKAGESREKGKRVYDCSICAQDVEVPVVPAGSSPDSLASTLLARRTYMVTPCRHIFHKDCLEGWMRYRLQCPNCRETIPPL